MLKRMVLLVAVQVVVTTLVLQTLRLLLPHQLGTSPYIQGFVIGLVTVGTPVAYNVATGRVNVRRRR